MFVPATDKGKIIWTHLEKKRTYPKELLELTGVTAEYLDCVEVDWDTENYVLDVMEGRDAAFYLPWAMKSSLVYLSLIQILDGAFVTLRVI